MTYAEAIEITDRRSVNSYTSDDKLRWLQQLDQQIYDEMIVTHVNTEHASRPENVSLDDKLLVADPYAEDIYVNFLQARIAKENEEDSRYNKAITLYNDGYSRWARRYHETHASVATKLAFIF